MREFVAVHFWKCLGEHLLMSCFCFFYFFLGLAAPIGSVQAPHFLRRMSHLSRHLGLCSFHSRFLIKIQTTKTIKQIEKERSVFRATARFTMVHRISPWCGRSPPYQDHSPTGCLRGRAKENESHVMSRYQREATLPVLYLMLFAALMTCSLYSFHLVPFFLGVSQCLAKCRTVPSFCVASAPPC